MQRPIYGRKLTRHITPIVSVQNVYNLHNETSENVLAACERRFGLGIQMLLACVKLRPWTFVS